MRPDKSDKKYAVIYCRVSSKSQLKGDGLNSQEHRCRTFAEQQGYEVEAVFPDSRSGQGDFMTRPGMVALLSYLDAQKHKDYVVIFDDLKRFSRDTEFHLKLRRILRLRNATVECLNFRFEDTPEGEFFETIVAAQAKLDAQQNARQSRQKSEARLNRGFWVFKAPVGYKYVPAKEGGKVLVRDEPVASILTSAMKAYASGHFRAVTEVIRHLESIPQFPKDTPSHGIRSQTMIRILRNPLYAGIVEAPTWGIGPVEGQHPPLISKQIHARILERMNERGFAIARKDTNADFPLRGAVACASCGKPLTGGWANGKRKKYPYYWCSNRKCSQSSKTIPRAKIESQFVDLLDNLTPSETAVRILHDMLQQLCEAYARGSEAQRVEFLAQAKELEKETDALLQRVVRASSPTLVEAYEERIEELQKEKMVLEEKASQSTILQLPFERVFEHSLDFLFSLKNCWNSGGLELRRLVLRLTFSDHLKYRRGEDFEHPEPSIIFKIMKHVQAVKSGDAAQFMSACGMVPPR